MKVTIVTVGKRSPTALNELINEYVKRLSGFNIGLEWRIVEPPKNHSSLPRASAINAESESIIKRLPSNTFIILLDISGQQLSSPEFAMIIEDCKNSPGNLTLIIGGPYGVSDDVKAKADIVWCLSRLILPHLLVRLLVAEQLYRASTISAGHAYHHG